VLYNKRYLDFAVTALSAYLNPLKLHLGVLLTLLRRVISFDNYGKSDD
jgi:hypothetical protein